MFEADDIAALNRRAARFQREHEIERQKSSRSFSNGNHNSSSSYGSHANTHLFKSRSGTPAAYDAADEPEADPVSPGQAPLVGLSLTVHRMCLTGIAILLLGPPLRSLRIICG